MNSIQQRISRICFFVSIGFSCLLIMLAMLYFIFPEYELVLSFFIYAVGVVVMTTTGMIYYLRKKKRAYAFWCCAIFFAWICMALPWV